MNQEVKYKTYSANTTDRDSTDGELALSLNVAMEDGGLTPLMPPKVELDPESLEVDWSDFDGDKSDIWELYNRKVMCNHQTEVYTHYIVVCDYTYKKKKQPEKWICWVDKANKAKLHPLTTQTSGGVTSQQLISGVNSITAIGNTLVVLGDQTHYLLWKANDDEVTGAKGNHYYYLGTQIPELDLSFGLQAEMVKGEESNPDWGNYPQDLNAMFRGIPDGLLYGYNDSVALNTQVLGEVNKFIADNATNKGRFMYPFLVRYAYRLYDGTLTMHSSPVLMLPCSGMNPQAVWNEDSRCARFWQRADGDHVIDALWYTVYGIVADLDYGIIEEKQRKQLLLWSDIVSSVDIFISAPIYTYNQAGTLKRFSAKGRYDVIGQVWMNDSHDASYGSDTYEAFQKITQKYGSYPPSRDGDGAGCHSEHWGDYDYWADYSTEEPYTIARQIKLGSCYYDPDRTGTSDPTDKESQKAFEELMNRAVSTENLPPYYLKKTFTEMYRESWMAKKQRWRDIKEETSLDINAQFQSVNNLGRIVLPCHPEQTVLQRIRECQTFYLLKSIDIIDLPTSTSESRRKIEVADDYLQSLTNREVMTDDYDSHEVKAGTYAMSYNSRLHLANIKKKTFDGYHLQAMLPFANGGWTLPETSETSTAIVAPVAIPSQIIKIHSVLEVGQRVVTDHGDSQWGGGNVKPIYLYFPDTDAKKFELSINRKWITKSYRTHDFLNGAVFVSDDMGGIRDATGAAQTYTPTGAMWYDLPNKLYVSEINNPFFFPVNSINTIGSGRIIGLSTCAKALSQGQFGEFPLYAFCSDGVWAMTTTSTGGYSTKQPITRDVCINTNAITQIDSSVLFATNRGIMELSGSTAKCITDVLYSQYPFTLDKMPGAERLVDLYNQLSTADEQTTLAKVTIAPFLTFIKSCQMVYDYTHQRIIVYNPSYNYAYVLSLKGGGWGMINVSLSSNVLSYPNAMAVDGQNRLVNFAETDAENRTALILTRPLKLGDPNVFKTIDTLIQRGYVEPHNVKQVLYGSNNLADWFVVWSSQDIYMTGFRGTPYKFFRLAVVADVDSNNKLDGFSISLTPKQTNKLR